MTYTREMMMRAKTLIETLSPTGKDDWFISTETGMSRKDIKLLRNSLTKNKMNTMIPVKERTRE